LLPAAHFQCLMFTNMRMMMVMVYWPLKNNTKNKEKKKESFAWICLKVCQHVVACQCFTLQTVTQNLSFLLSLLLQNSALLSLPIVIHVTVNVDWWSFVCMEQSHLTNLKLAQ
jgi:hypothetical protein